MDIPYQDRIETFAPTVLTAALAGVAGVAGSYVAAGYTPSFVVAPIEATLSRTMPGAVITFAIQNLGSLGQDLNLALAVALAVALASVLTALGVAVGRRLESATASVVLAGGLTWGFAYLTTGVPAPSLGMAVPVVILVTVEEALVRRETVRQVELSAGRRRVVETVATAAGVGTLAVAFGSGSDSPEGKSLSALDNATRDADTPVRTTNRTNADDGNETQTQQSDEEDQQSATEALLSEADRKSFDLPGMDPLVSEDFYRVDINAVDPDLKADDWSLTVTGAVEQEVTVDYAELTSMASEDRFNTLRCVGEKLNGHKMDTALWTGVPIMDVVDRAAPQSGCECVMLRAADDYYEEFPLEAMQNGLLAYGMNGKVLPRAHGYPVRALVPGHWGEINVKWLTEIEILDTEAKGYWEKRGWHGTGPVKTVAKLHSTDRLDDGRIRVGGHTYAGTRGIRAVEVSTDGGDTWNEATLTEPLPGDDVWRQWKYTYDPPSGSHEVVVRAIDGTGTVQPKKESNPYPSGPSGWVSKTIQ